MKKILTTLTLLITLCSYAFGQYDYHFDQPGVWEGAGMRIGYGEVYIDGSIQKNVDYIEIAAFINNEVHGRQLGISDALKSFTIGGANKFDNSEITFKVFNHLTNEELTAEETAIYLDEQVLGPGPWDPYKIFFTTSQPVAKIGNTEYNTLAAAVEAATEGNNEITLLRNAEGKGIVIDKNITIDFNTFTYTFVEEGVGDTPTKSNGFQILAGNTVTLKNGALNVDEESKDDFYILIQNYSNLTVENMKLDGTNLDMWSTTDGDSYVLSNNSGKVNVIGTTKIIANKDGDLAFALDACYNPAYTAPVVTLGENVTVDGKVELTGGQLYTTKDNLTIVAKKKFNKVSGDVGATKGWGTISTPIANVNIPANENHDLYMYEEKTAMWRYYTNENGENAGQPFSTFELGQGYLYANKSDITIELEGTLNTKPVKRGLTYTTEMEALAGFNFVGNPFAHNIGETNFSTTNGARLSNGFYVISAEGAIVARPENAVISPMESVMVQTNKETELTINNVPSSKRNAEDNGRLEISVANANYSDVAYVSFNEGRGLNKIAHRNAEIPMVYVPVDGINYAVATMNQDVTEIPVSFKAATIGEYTIGAETQNCEYAMMTLVDRFTGIETNLLIEDYTFIAKSNDSAERFFIRLDNGQQSTDNSHFAYINNGMMYIYNIEGQGVVNVYDVTGRPVAEYNVAESANISTSEFAAGVYIIRMSDENGVKVQKIVVE